MLLSVLCAAVSELSYHPITCAELAQLKMIGAGTQISCVLSCDHKIHTFHLQQISH